VLAPFVGRIVDRSHPRSVVGFGFTVMTISLTWLSVLRTVAPTAGLRFKAHQSRSTHLGPLKSTNCQSVSNVYLNQSHRIAACTIQTNSATVTMGFLKITRTRRLFCTAHLHRGARMVVAQQVPQLAAVGG
jgi:hypothetical protein